MSQLHVSLCLRSKATSIAERSCDGAWLRIFCLEASLRRTLWQWSLHPTPVAWVEAFPVRLVQCVVYCTRYVHTHSYHYCSFAVVLSINLWDCDGRITTQGNSCAGLMKGMGDGRTNLLVHMFRVFDLLPAREETLNWHLSNFVHHFNLHWVSCFCFGFGFAWIPSVAFRNCMYFENVYGLLGKKPEMKRVISYLIQEQNKFLSSYHILIEISTVTGDCEAWSDFALGNRDPAECWACCNFAAACVLLPIFWWLLQTPSDSKTFLPIRGLHLHPGSAKSMPQNICHNMPQLDPWLSLIVMIMFVNSICVCRRPKNFANLSVAGCSPTSMPTARHGMEWAECHSLSPSSGSTHFKASVRVLYHTLAHRRWAQKMIWSNNLHTVGTLQRMHVMERKLRSEWRSLIPWWRCGLPLSSSNLVKLVSLTLC